jgi:phage terminase large subunit GpA-like protein
VANNQSSIINNQFPRPLALQPEELDVLTPEDRKTLLEWMESEYHLSKKVHGLSSRWSSEYGPFWIPIIECLDDAVTREVWVYAPAQAGKSTLMTGWMGYTIDCDPVPMGLVMPRDDDAGERVETNIVPMFESNPRLLRHIGGNARRINVGKMTMFDNMAFYLLFATSAAAMAGKSICRIGLDEVGKYQARVGREADAVSLARDRLETFKGRSKLFGVTTPVVKDDLADREFKKGDLCEWHVPCSHCRRWQRPAWSNVSIDKDTDGGFFDTERYRKGGLARYICPHCKKPWSEMDRWSSICEGRFVAADCTIDEWGHIAGPSRRSTVRSFRITGLMLHPAVQTIDYLASRWVDAISEQRAGDTAPLQGFINSRLAEVWEQKEKEPDEAKLYPHIGGYDRGIVPPGVKIITTTVDVQLDHVWIASVGWGYQFEGWLLFAGRIETGDTEKVENFGVVREFLGARWPIADRKDVVMRPAMAGIDSGYRTDQVYSLCRQWAELSVVPLMGWPADRMAGRLYRTVKLGDGLVRFDLNVDTFKDAVYRQLFVAEAPGPGYMHLYRDIPHEYLRHFTAEAQSRVRKGRRWFLIWEKKDRHLPNHLWDLLVYARLLAELAGVPALANPEAKTVIVAPPGKPVGRRPIRTKY